MNKKTELIEKGFKCEVDFSPAFDRRHSDPSKNYGTHGVEMRFVLIGEKGASQFLVYTNWHLPSVSKEGWRNHMHEPMGADVGYHAKSPQYEDQDVIDDNCQYIGCPCYYDGSGLRAETLLERFISEGEDSVWSELEDVYNNIS